MKTLTYGQLYSNPSNGIIRNDSDKSIEGIRNGRICTIVCDRKWGFSDSVELLFYLDVNSNGEPEPQPFEDNDYWWSIIQSDDDKNLLETFGCSIDTDTSSNLGYGVLISEPTKFQYEVLGLYTDNGITESATELSNMSIGSHKPTDTQNYVVTVDSTNAVHDLCLSWKIKNYETVVQ